VRAPGVTIRPIRSLTGEYENCEVFYDEVRLPLSRVVGALNEGWSVAMTTLAIERGTASFGEACQLAGFLEQLIDYARTTAADDGRPLIANEAIAQALGEARAEMHGLHALLLATVARAERGLQPGSEGSFIRLYMTESAKRVWRLAMDLLGVQGLNRSRHGRWIARYLGSFALTIAGGTAEIQRNVIGERVLGLPR
jgi:alkylation response protein AidB-like acyl-CoA dehydrogenase